MVRFNQLPGAIDFQQSRWKTPIDECIEDIVYFIYQWAADKSMEIKQIIPFVGRGGNQNYLIVFDPLN